MKKYIANDGSKDIEVYILDVDDIKNMSHTSSNVSQLTLATVDDFKTVFPGTNENLTLFARSDTAKSYYINAGFRNVYNFNDLIGDVWSFTNGSTIEFSQYGLTLKKNDFSYTLPVTYKCIPVPIIKNDLIGASIYDAWSDIPAYAYRYFSIYIYDSSMSGLTIYFANVNLGGSVSYWGIYYNVAIDQTFYNNLLDWYNGLTPAEDSTDPYSPGGNTDTGGGTGTFDNTTEPIPVPDVPLTSVAETGFISLYRPDLAQLRALATYLWGTGFDLDTFKKIFADPISAILGLSLVPLSPAIGASSTVVIGNIDSGVSMPKVTSQYIKYSCGSLAIEEYWGGYLDYSPYTQAEIYLPFIGTKPLNIDDIMGKTLSLWYMIDVLSGGCVACLESGGSVLYQFIGQCACSIPVTGRDMTNLINGVISAASAGAAGFAMGGIGLGALGIASSVAGNVTSMKPHIEKSGNMGGMGGMLGVKTPYIILTRPRQALPANQNVFTGYPSYITSTLGDCTGFTVVQDIHLAGFSATEEEKREIERLLKEGVIM